MRFWLTCLPGVPEVFPLISAEVLIVRLKVLSSSMIKGECVSGLKYSRVFATVSGTRVFISIIIGR
jgi:hypothetical protein